MVSEGEGGGPGGRGRKRSQSELRQVPWQSWKEWSVVRTALSSGCPRRISSALDRIAAWRSRGDVPVAVEISGHIIRVHQRDAAISTGLSADMALPEEMLRMLYAMAIMRLVNGVVDQSQKRNSTSVATRAESVGLPRLLVDIRHESAHNELPAISLLRLGSKEALSWLELHYWKFQEQKLFHARAQLKFNLMEYIVLLHRTSAESSPQGPSIDDGVEVPVARKQLKKARKALKQQKNLQFNNLLELSSASSDLVSIILAEGWLEQEFLPGQEHTCQAVLSSEQSEREVQDPTGTAACSGPLEDQAARLCKYVIQRLAVHRPELPLILLTAIIDRLCESKFPEVPLLERQARGDNLQDSGQETQNSKFSRARRLIDWSAWLLDVGETGEEIEAFPAKPCKSHGDQGPRASTRGGALTDQLLWELLLKCLRGITANKLLDKPVTLLARRIGNKCLSKQAVLLAKLGTVDSICTSRSVLVADDIPGKVTPARCIESLGQVMDTHVPRELLCPGISNEVSGDLVDVVESREPPSGSMVSFADAKERQKAFLRSNKCQRGPKASMQSGVTNPTRKWRLMSDWTPCPIGLLPPGRYMEVEDVDDIADDTLEERLGVGRMVVPETGVSYPSSAVAATVTLGDERDIQEAGDTPLSNEDRALKDSLSGKEEVVEVKTVQKQNQHASTQEPRPLKGFLLQNGCFQYFGYEQLAILQASVRVL